MNILFRFAFITLLAMGPLISAARANPDTDDGQFAGAVTENWVRFLKQEIAENLGGVPVVK